MIELPPKAGPKKDVPSTALSQKSVYPMPKRMKSISLAALLLISLFPLSAWSQMDCEDTVDDFLWSKDGRFLTYEKHAGSTSGPIDTNDIVVFDLSAGKVETTFVSYAEAHLWDGGHGGAERELAKLERKAKRMTKEGKRNWRAWASKNPVVEAAEGLRSPNKKAAASYWFTSREDSFVVSVMLKKKGQQRVLCPGEPVVAGEFGEWLPLFNGHVDDDVNLGTTYWSPDSRHLVVHVVAGEDCYGTERVFVCSVEKAKNSGFVAVEIRSQWEYGQDDLALVQAMNTSGFAHVQMTAALKAEPRKKSTIYAKDVTSKEAEKLAGIVRGGAIVEKLSWPAKADLVLALGDSYHDLATEAPAPTP